MHPLIERLKRWIRSLRDAAVPPPGLDDWRDGHFEHQDRLIGYKIFVPARHSGKPRPLIVMLHGCKQNPADFAAGTQMNRLASERGFLVLYPEQTDRANPAHCWNWFMSQNQARDRGEPALLAALTQSVIATENVDPARVYVAGLSAGGAMADIVARTHADVFAAVGVHSGLPRGAAGNLMSGLIAMKRGCAPVAADGLAMPTIVFHGDADTAVHPANADRLVDAALAARTGTPPEPKTTTSRSDNGREFTQTVYADATGQSLVEHWQVHGAGHAWSGGSPAGGFTDPTGPDASAQMMRFFFAHPMPSVALTRGCVAQ